MRAARAAIVTVLLSTVLVSTVPLQGQVPGDVSFRILEHGAPIGDARVTVARADAGWTLTGSGTLAGSVGLEVRRFELTYDAAWRGRAFSIELASSTSHVIAHAIVAVLGARTRTDIVLEKEVRPVFNHVSPHAVFLPDYVLPAFIALPPRLAGAGPGDQLPAFVPLRTEFALMEDAVERVFVAGASGPIAATHWRLRFDNGPPSPIDLWEGDGHLLRVDLVEDALSMVRSDLR